MRPARWCASCASGAKLGLLYGQGGFVTKHHALVLSRQAPPRRAGAGHQRAGRSRPHRGAVPEFVTEAKGKGKVESFTVIYGRNGEVEHGVVMLRTAEECARAGAGAGERRGDAGASSRHGPHAGGVVRRYRDGGGWRAGVAGGVELLSRTCGERVALLPKPVLTPIYTAEVERTLRCAASGMTPDRLPTPSRPAFPTPSRACPWRRRRGPDRRRQGRRAARR